MKPGAIQTADPIPPASPEADATPAAPSLKARVASGASWSLLDNASQQILSLVIFVVLGRLLSPALFGIVSTAMVFVFLMRSMILNSIQTAIVTLRAPSGGDYDAGFWLCLIISCAAVAIINGAAGIIAHFYRLDEFSIVIRSTSVVILFSGLSYAHGAWAKRNFRFKSLAMRNTISTAVAGAIGIAVALAGYGLTALVLNQVVAGVLALLLLWRAIPWRPRLRFEWARARAILATAVPLGANQGLQFVAQNFDTALVTWLLGPFGGGLYAAAKRVVLAVQIALWQPLASVALPAFAEVSGEPERFGNAAVRMSRLVMAITAPLFAGIALTAPVAVEVLFGHKWLGAAPIMTVLAGFGVLVPSLSLLGQMLVARGQARAVLLITLAQMAVALLALALTGRTDAVAVALCLSAPTLFAFVATLAILARVRGFPLGRYLIAIGRPLACAGIMAGVVSIIPDLHAGPLAQLVVLAVAGGAAYAAASLLIAREAVAELTSFARGMLPKRFGMGTA